MTRNVHPLGHTRLPRYARGKRGVINVFTERRSFPTANAHGLGEHPQPLYSVCFDARELWGDSAEAAPIGFARSVGKLSGALIELRLAGAKRLDERHEGRGR